MPYSDEHKRLAPVLEAARRLDIASNPAPEAIFEAGTAGFQIWCTPGDRPVGWEGIAMHAGAFSKPCAYVASVTWQWEEDRIVGLTLSTDAYELAEQKPDRYRRGVRLENGRESIRNRTDDLIWAKKKVRWLFERAGVPCPPIMVGE